MAVVLSSPTSILLCPSRGPFLTVPHCSALSSSATSSSSASSSSDHHRPSSSRRIRFAPLPEPRHDDGDDHCHVNEPDDAPCSEESHPDVPQDASDSDQSDDLVMATKHTIIDVYPPPPPVDPVPAPVSPPSVPPVSRASRLLRSLPFFRRSPHAPPSPASHPRDASAPRPPSSSGLPAPVPSTRRPLHISTDVRGSLPFFRRSGHPPRGRSPPPPPSPTSSTSPPSTFYRTTSRASVQSCPPAENKDEPKHDRRASSILPGAGGGRHSSSTKMISSPLARPSTAPSSPYGNSAAARKAGGRRMHVQLLNGRVYGAKRPQAPANPFDSAREEPEFVEWGYGGMGSVTASRDVCSAVWKSLHSNSASPISPTNTAAAAVLDGSKGRKRMSQTAPECGMGHVGVGGGDEDDGSGLAWVKRRREAKEREAREKAEREAREREALEGEKEPRRSAESVNTSMRSTSASSGTTATTLMTGAGTSPVTSTRTSVTDLSSSAETKPVQQDPHDITPRASEYHHRVLTTLLNPLHNQKGDVPSPIESDQVSPSTSGSQDDDEEEEELDKHRKTSIGARIEKVSRHHGVGGGGGGGSDP